MAIRCFPWLFLRRISKSTSAAASKACSAPPTALLFRCRRVSQHESPIPNSFLVFAVGEHRFRHVHDNASDETCLRMRGRPVREACALAFARYVRPRVPGHLRMSRMWQRCRASSLRSGRSSECGAFSPLTVDAPYASASGCLAPDARNSWGIAACPNAMGCFSSIPEACGLPQCRGHSTMLRALFQGMRSR